DLEEGNDAALLQAIGHGLATARAVHGLFEQDRAENLAIAEAGALDDAAAHLVDQRELLVVAVPSSFLYAVTATRLRGGTSRLVERGDEALARCDAIGHFLLIHRLPLGLCIRMRASP